MLKEMLSRLGFYISYLIVRIIVASRYRIEIVGIEKLDAEHLTKPGGILFLPNHHLVKMNLKR